MSRSDTESKKAPRGDAVPDALATAPSSRSGTAVRTSRSRPARRAPLAMATLAATAISTPSAVRWSADEPGAVQVGADGTEALLHLRAEVLVEHGYLGRPAGRAGRCSANSCKRTGARASEARSSYHGAAAREACEPGRRGKPMHRYASDRIRNVALIGHHGSGKTTVAEALVAHGGGDPPPWSRRGWHHDVRPRAGGARSGHVPVALAGAVRVARPQDQPARLPRARPTAPARCTPPCRWPTWPSLVVSAVEGVEAQTEAAWDLAAELGVPRLVFVNKLDRERSDFDRVLARAPRRASGRASPPSSCRSAREAELHGLVDVLQRDRRPLRRRQGHPRRAGARRARRGRAPRARRGRRGDRGRRRRPARALPRRRRAVGARARARPHRRDGAAASSSPCCAARPPLDVGIDRLADYLVEIGPPPDRPSDDRAGRRPGHRGAVRRPAATRWPSCSTPSPTPTSATSPSSGSLSGTIKSDDHLTNSRTGGDERLHGLFTLAGQGPRRRRRHRRRRHRRRRQAQRHPDRRRARAEGQAGAHRAAAAARTPSPPSPWCRARRATTTSSARRSPASARRTRRCSSSGPPPASCCCAASATSSSRVAIDRLQRRFGVTVDTEPLRVAYRETITGDGRGRGPAQEADRRSRAVRGVRAPGRAAARRARASQFVDKIVGGADLARATSRRCRRASRRRWPRVASHGFPVVDVKVTLLDGKEHTVDSSELAFKLAGQAGVPRCGGRRPSPVVLEPVSMVDVDVPADLLGDVLGDLNSPARQGGRHHAGRRRAARSSPRSCPTGELVRYSAELRSLTGGRGRFAVEHHHDEVVPANLVDRLVSGLAAAGVPGR